MPSKPRSSAGEPVEVVQPSSTSQLKNPENKHYVDVLVAYKGAAKDPIRIANIEACLKKARETPDAIRWDQVIWAYDGKTAAIDHRLEQIGKAHDKNIDAKKVFALTLDGGCAMMAGQENNSSSSIPKQPV